MDETQRRRLSRHRGERVDRPVADETEHFYICQACGQAVDMRDLGQVFHHEDQGHKPIPPDA